MTGLLPSGMRCTGFWYATARGLPTDIDYLKALGATAARMAVWEELMPWQVQEGPYFVYMWPERIFDAASQGLVWDQGCDEAWGSRGPSASYREWRDEGLPRTRVVHCKRETFDVDIGRPGPWGNPFRIGPDGTRDQVIAKFEAYLLASPQLMAALPELRGKVLGCWCKPESCHGDVLARYADRGGYGPDDVIPPWCPLPRGDQAPPA